VEEAVEAQNPTKGAYFLVEGDERLPPDERRTEEKAYCTREDHCERCGEEGEGLFHIAFKCTFAVGFWQKVKEIIGCKVPALHPATWTRDLLSGDVCSERDVALIVCGVWSLWSGRNARCHGKIKWNAIAAAKHIAAMIEDLMGMHISEERTGKREMPLAETRCRMVQGEHRCIIPGGVHAGVRRRGH